MEEPVKPPIETFRVTEDLRRQYRENFVVQKYQEQLLGPDSSIDTANKANLVREMEKFLKKQGIEGRGR